MFVIFVAVMVFPAQSALASAPPSLQFVKLSGHQGYGSYGDDRIYVFSTRMYAEANLFVNGLDTKWRAEYSTSKAALEEGSGTIASNGEQQGNIGGGGENIQFGVGYPWEVVFGENFRILYDLVPNTHYFARFLAENSAGTATLPFEFTTAPILKPEIDGYNFNQGASFVVGESSPTTAKFGAQIQTNGATTEYSFGYSTASPSGPFTTCASGSITAVEDAAYPHVECTGLTPETKYYVRVLASNKEGTTEQTAIEAIGGHDFVITPTAKPVTFLHGDGEGGARNVTALSAHLTGSVLPHHEETRWRFESAASVIGPWLPVPGAAGTISQAEAEALPEGYGVSAGGAFAGLTPATTYYVRLSAENAAGEAQNGFGEPVSSETRGIGSFQTTGPPSATTLAIHALHGESLHVVGSVDPNSTPTSEEQLIAVEGAPTGGTFMLTFKGRTTEPIAFDASAESVQSALKGLSSENANAVKVEGPAGGPYTVSFYGPLAGSDQPQIQADGSGLSPSGSVSVSTTLQGGLSYDAHYHFQYVSEDQFKVAGKWAAAVSTPEVDVGAGASTKFVGADLPALTPGETYRYRVIATSTFPGDPVAVGGERALTVPVVASGEASLSCPNQALRSGPSGNLPDCRGYEQLTPVFKEGAREPFLYGLTTGGGLAIGEDGDHVVLEADDVNWGAGPGTGQSPYFFSRQEGVGWRMTAASIQPEAGVDNWFPELLAPDLASFGFSTEFQTSPEIGSKEIDYRMGPPGGPYTTVATMPVSEAGLGWVGASRDFSRLFLELADHSLLGSPTGTKQGEDLYEYAGGELRQVNVTGSAPGTTIGACGASIVRGGEEAGTVSSVHAVSSDGSRVLFEAIPGNNCSAPSHLYMRMDGQSTLDLGAYQFVAANSDGTALLLEKRSGETSEILLYETERDTLKPLFSASFISIGVSENLNAIYFTSNEQLTPDAPPAGSNSLYRYDVPGQQLSFIDTASTASNEAVQKMSQSPDGRYLYFQARDVGGVPGGQGSSEQVYRYDSAESLIQCMSCASPFDPEPKLSSVFGEVGGTGGVLQSRTGDPRIQFASGNGDYVFFDTPSALLPSDVDGEVPPEPQPGGAENSSGTFSVSSDVYEWRKPGVDGCAHVQGCLALITNGRGGFLNVLLGTDESGRDVFIYTNSRLVGQDNDSAGDIYDARIGGGTPLPPPRPVECEGDACSTPASAPNDATPSSLTFSGAGNLVQSSSSPAAKSKKPKPKSKKPKPKSKKPKPKSKKPKPRPRVRHGRHRGKKGGSRRARIVGSSERSKR